MGPTGGPSGADRTQVGSMLAQWTLLFGWFWYTRLSTSIMTNAKCFHCRVLVPIQFWLIITLVYLERLPPTYCIPQLGTLMPITSISAHEMEADLCVRPAFVMSRLWLPWMLLCWWKVSSNSNLNLSVVCFYPTYLGFLCFIIMWCFNDHKSNALWKWQHILTYSDTLMLRQNGRHFPDNILKCIFLNDNVWISINLSLKFVPKGQINNIPAPVPIMAWCLPGDKPLSKPIMSSLLTQISVTWPQWVNTKDVTTYVDMCIEWSYFPVELRTYCWNMILKTIIASNPMISG